MDLQLEQRPTRSAHAFELRFHDRLVAHVEWHQDPHRRDLVGWYLISSDSGARERRLDVDPAIDMLARQRDRTDPQWTAAADSVAALSATMALVRAEHMLHGTTTRTPSPPTAMRRYEFWLTRADAETIGFALPALAFSTRGDLLIASGRLDDAGLQAVLGRLRELGTRLLGLWNMGP
jgi:hypothetical protein